MKKVILTGFEPFGPYRYNPTQQSTLDFNGRTIGDREVIGIVLPCTYNAWEILEHAILYTEADTVISTGFSSGVQGMRIESLFRNMMWGKYPDANGYEPNHVQLVEAVVPEKISSKAPHKKLVSLLDEHGIPAELSTDADTFICNALGYRTSLEAWEGRGVVRNLFVHVPWTTDYQDRVSIDPRKIFLPKDLYYKGLELLIQKI